ncbi:unnamed protein product [Chrysoparadoxa australica]
MEGIDPKLSVQQYLETQCEGMLNEIDAHAMSLVGRLKEDLSKGQQEVMAAVAAAGGQGEGGQEVLPIVKLEATVGPHKGKSWVLKPAQGVQCMIGRSSGKKFKENGVSLPKDKEVSTTHGKVHCMDNKIFFTDTGSTNGTRVGGVYLDEGSPQELTEGLQLEIGDSVLVVSLGST